MTVNITVDATRDMSFNLKEIENGIYSRSALSLVVEEAFYERQFHNCDGKKKNQLTELQMTLSGEAGDSRVPWNSISLLLDLLTLKGSFFFSTQQSEIMQDTSQINSLYTQSFISE